MQVNPFDFEWAWVLCSPHNCSLEYNGLSDELNNTSYDILTQVAETLLEGQVDSGVSSGSRHTLEGGQNEVHNSTIQVHSITRVRSR